MKIRTAIGSLAVKILSIALATASVFILARTLGPEGYGVYAYAMAVITALSFPARGGIPALATRELAYAIVDGRRDLSKGIFLRSNHAVLAVALGASCAAAAVLLVIYSNEPSSKLRTLGLALLLLPTIALGGLRGALLYGAKRVLVAQLPEYVVRPFVLLCVVGVLLLGQRPITPEFVMLAHVGAGIVAFVVGAQILRRHVPQLFVAGPVAFDDRRWFRAAIPFTVVGGAAIVAPQIPLVALGLFLDMEKVALFRVGAQVGMVMLLAHSMINLVISPYVASAFREGDHGELQRLVRAAARIAILFSAPVLVGFVIIGRSALLAFFGDEYVEAYYPAVILCVGFNFRATFAAVETVLKMTGSEKAAGRSSIVSLLACGVLSFTLVPHFGLYGAAVASVGAQVVSTALLLVSARRLLPIRFGPV